MDTPATHSVPALEPHCGSWIVSRIKDDSVVGEFFNATTVSRFNPATCRIETAAQYLGRINRLIAAQRTSTSPLGIPS